MTPDLVTSLVELEASRSAILGGAPASRETRERLNDSIFEAKRLLKAVGGDDGDEREPLGNADDLRAELADVIARHEALKERERASRGLSTLQRRQLQDLAERAATIRVMLHEQMKSDMREAFAGRAAAAADDDDAPKFSKRTSGTRKLGDAIPDRGLIYKAAEPRCVCASAHHRTCTYCGECAVLCGHRPV